MKLKLGKVALIALSMAPINVFAAGVAIVSNSNESGAGSLQAAFASGASTIRIAPSVGSISITQPLIYDGERRFKLIGHGQTIDASGLTGNADIISVSQGVDVSISNLNLIGNSFTVNPDPSITVGGKGVFVNIPASKQGLVKISLDNVTVSHVGNHGIHVSDCALRDACGGGSGGAGNGSDASIYLKLDNVMVNNVGFGKQDADGVRVDERGEGDIYFVARHSEFLNVGADGIELDEGNNGDVVADVSDVLFDSNGEYCVAIPFVAGSACDDEGDPDVDDGFDIDEAGSGSLYARIIDTTVSNNFDEGLDFDEEDDGDIALRLRNIVATSNADEGVKASEEGAGNLNATLRNLTLADNNGAKEGIELEEADAGNVLVRVRESVFVGGPAEALKVEQADDGNGSLRIINTKIDELDLDGVTLR